MRRLSRMRKMRKINAASENGANRSGFSLMEMMVVLLIMSIIMAASAPIVSRKLSKSAAGGASPWVFTGTTGNIAYNIGGKKVSAIIGAAKLPSNAGSPRLYIDCGTNSDAQIAFGRGNDVAKVIADPQGWKVGISNATIPQTSVAFGGGQTLSSSPIVAVGYGVSATQTGATAVGPAAKAGLYGTSMGYYAEAGERAIALGQQAKASESKSIVVGYGAKASYSDSVVIGANASSSGRNSVVVGGNSAKATQYASALGDYAVANGIGSVAIGNNSKASNYRSIAVGGAASGGNATEASGSYSTAIGTGAVASGSESIAVGDSAKASNSNTIAIGYAAEARYTNSIAIGRYTTTTSTNQIVLGSSSDTVYIPGNLVVDGNTYLARNTGHYVWARLNDEGNTHNYFNKLLRKSGARECVQAAGDYTGSVSLSDRRLKNVGEKYVAGLDALKKLDFYHYTFKNDEAKTPHVGIMAQDLRKVFPDAVNKAQNGYLTIRTEDMFYAVINAVKELDEKFTAILDDIMGMKSKIEAQDKTIADLQAIINEQNERIEKLEELINKTR